MHAAENGSVSARPMVVVVDDDAALCSSLKFALELEGFAVRTYKDGAALLGDMEPVQADCLVIDQRLPGLNGLDLLERLRRRKLDTPALLITTNPSWALREMAERAGVRIVEKPLLSSALSDEIRRLLGPRAPAANRRG